MANIKISAFSDEYSPKLDEQLQGLGKLGFYLMEPRFFDGVNVSELTEEEAKSIAYKLNSAGVLVYSVGSPLGKISITDDFDKHLELAKNTFRNAKILGASRIRMFSFYFPDTMTREQARPFVIERLGKLLDLADEYGLTLCHENEGRIYGENADQCYDILSHFGGRLRCVFDMGNFLLAGEEPYPYAYNLLKDYIDYFHIKDGLEEGAIVPPGLGNAKIYEILKAYTAEKSEFVITLEPHLETFSGLNKLTETSFDNPYKFASPEEAFLEAGKRLKDIVNSL